MGYAVLLYFRGGNGVRWMLAAVDHALELLSALSCIVISQKKFLNHHNRVFYFSEFVSRRKKKL